MDRPLAEELDQHPADAEKAEPTDNHMAGRKTVWAKKMEANRRNSRKSTGPRTPQGKRRSSQNALLHGLTARHIVVQDRNGGEHQADYNQLIASLNEYFEPQGILERMCVETIATCYWRRQRVFRTERGLIARNLAEKRDYLRQEKVDTARLNLLPQLEREASALTDHLALPSREDIDKLLRYEAMIDKQLQRAMGQLDILQSRRKAHGQQPNSVVEVVSASAVSAKRSQ